MTTDDSLIQDAPTVEQAIRRIAGSDATVSGRSPVAGGCISNGECLTLTNGDQVFAKRSSRLPATMFPAEAAGLEALACDEGPRVPRPLAVWPGEGSGSGRAPRGGGESFIIMEWIDTGRPRAGFHAEFGRALAHLHRSRTNDRYGFDGDNFIGSTEQPNAWSESWLEFFAKQRIGFQVRLAHDRKRIDSGLVRSIEKILDRIADILPEPERASLLHGDLWGGNYLCDSEGRAVLIDPAVYYGHPEADLAMTELFGGFRREFYRAYERVNPLVPGYAERRDLYNLYHMLNHLNLFGGGYLGSVRSIVSRYV